MTRPTSMKSAAGWRTLSPQVHRADDVIKSVTALFKNESTTRTEVYVNALVEQVLISTARARNSNRILLETNFVESPPPYVMADPVQLQQVILNLITNAIEAMSASQQWGEHPAYRNEHRSGRFRRDHGCRFRTWIRFEASRATLQAVLYDEIQRHGFRIVDLQIDH